MAYPIKKFVEYLVPFDFNAKIRVRITRDGIETIRQIEFVAVRIYAADKTQTPESNFSVRYYDTQKNAFTAQELVRGFIEFIPEIVIPHDSNGYICYCTDCNRKRAAENQILYTGDTDLPF